MNNKKINYLFLILALAIFGFLFSAGQTYAYSGTFTSSAIDTGQNSDFTTLNFTITKPTNTNLLFLLRSATTQAGLSSASWYGPSGGPFTDCSTPSNCYGTSGTAINSIHDGHRWIQYKAYFSATNSNVPYLSDITINYNYYAVGTYSLISSPYNTTDAANILSQIRWTENLPTGTEIKFQLRTGPDLTTLLSNPWCGPDDGAPGCTTTTYFTDPTGGETVDADFKDGLNDQWIQYKAFLQIVTTSHQTPTLSDVTLQYVVNAPPEFDATYGNNGVTASQVAAGQTDEVKVEIKYKIKDTDTISGTNSPNYVTVTFKYSLDGGSTWSGTIDSSYITYGDAPSGGEVTNSYGNSHMENKVLEGSYLVYTAFWDAKSQLGANTYLTNAKMRVTINDNEAANNTATVDSAILILDTKNPLISFYIDAKNSVPPTSPATLYVSASDDSSFEMMLSNNSNFTADSLNLDSGTWISYAATKSWLLNTEQTTVYLKIRDAVANQTTTSQIPPRKPSSLFFRDVSSPADNNYRIFIAWGTIPEPNPGFKDYKLWYTTESADGVYYLAETIVSRTTNYFIAGAPANSLPLNNELDPNSTYWFKLYSEDSNDNISQ